MGRDNKTQVMDVYFVDPRCETAMPAIIDIFTSWDGTSYAETNVRALAGPHRSVVGENINGVATIDRNPLNCPAVYPIC